MSIKTVRKTGLKRSSRLKSYLVQTQHTNSKALMKLRKSCMAFLSCFALKMFQISPYREISIATSSLTQKFAYKSVWIPRVLHLWYVKVNNRSRTISNSILWALLLSIRTSILQTLESVRLINHLRMEYLRISTVRFGNTSMTVFSWMFKLKEIRKSTYTSKNLNLASKMIICSLGSLRISISSKLKTLTSMTIRSMKMTGT